MNAHLTKYLRKRAEDADNADKSLKIARDLVKGSTWAASAGADAANTAKTVADALSLKPVADALTVAGKASGPIGAGYLALDAGEGLVTSPQGDIRPLSPMRNLGEWGGSIQENTKLNPDSSNAEQLKAMWRGFRTGATRPMLAPGAALDVGTQAAGTATRGAWNMGLRDFLRFMFKGRTK